MFSWKTWGIIKNIVLCCLIACGVLYCALYFAAPYFLNKKDTTLAITKAVEKSTGLVVLIDGHKLSLSPRLDIKLKTDNISVFYPNKKQFLDIEKAELEFSPLAMLKKEICVRNIAAENVQLSTKLLKNGKTSLQEYIDSHVDKSAKLDYKLSESIPSVHISKYLVKVKDEQTSQRLKIKGEKLYVTQNPDFRYITLTTNGAVFVSNEKRIGYSAKLELPKDLLEADDFNNKISLEGVFKQQYFADLNANLKLFSKNSKFDYANGSVSIDNFVFYLADKKLPPSYFHIKTHKGNAVVDSKFYTNKDEITNINANLKLQKPYSADIKFNCPSADIANLHKLGAAVLDLLNIKNNLSDFNANGVLKADFSVLWRQNSLKSDGKLKISNASIVHKSVPLKITSANAFVDFSNDKFDIKKSSALVNNQPVKVSGHVLSNSTGKLSVSAENLDLNNLIKAFPFIKINNDIALKSGKLSFTADLSGKLTEASPVVNAVVNGLSGTIKSAQSVFSVSKLQVITKIVKNKPSGEVVANGLTLQASKVPTQVALKSDCIKAQFDDKNLNIKQSRLSTGNANLTLLGDIKNYQQKPDVNINLRGSVDTNFLKSLAPKEVKLYNKGYLPVRIDVKSLSGNANSYDIDLKVLANSLNYITPVMVKNLSGKTSLTHLQAVLNDSDINIKDLSLYHAQNINSLVGDVNISGLKKILFLKGKIKNYTANSPVLDNIKFVSIEPLIVELPDFAKSSATVSADLTLNGALDSRPSVNGNLIVDNIAVPDFLLTAANAVINLKNNSIYAKLNNVKIDNTLLSLEMHSDIPSDISKFNKINSLNINADFLDFEKTIALLQKMFQAKYAPGADVPFDISAGKINLKTVKMDILAVQNVTADISQVKNIFYLKNLSANAYGGKVAGNITYNLPYTSMKAVLQGRGMNAESATTALMPKEQRLSGVLNFDADISTVGNNFEQQMKSLTGRADLLIKNGYFAQLGRFEHFLYAQNLLSQKLIFANLNSAIQAISPQDTGRFTYLKGMAKFSKGYVHLNPVATSGPQMSMYITGRINMLTNEADLKFLGKVSSEVSSSLGLLGKMTIKDFVDEHTKYGQALADLFNFCNSELPEVDISRIPDLSPDMRYQTKNFQVLLNGNMSSVKSVKSFTWVNPLGTKKKAAAAIQDTVTSSIPTEQIQQQTVDNTTPVESQPKPQEVTTTPNFLDNIPDNFN